ncbi:unnamed protein product [Leptosia nina]|uniref:RNase H type-1 domain-containing protein n=1 Tax=Leptosia nina TaxID=320188 RepID=A0AAV1K0J0_9NEOP
MGQFRNELALVLCNRGTTREAKRGRPSTRVLEEELESKKEKARTISILSDSKSSLLAVTGAYSNHNLVCAARKLITLCKESGKHIELLWVEAHAEAALYLTEEPHYKPCPISYAKKLIRTKTKTEWHERYSKSETATVTKLLFPCPSSAFK